MADWEEFEEVRVGSFHSFDADAAAEHSLEDLPRC